MNSNVPLVWDESFIHPRIFNNTCKFSGIFFNIQKNVKKKIVNFFAKLTFSTLFTIWHICAKAAILVGHPIMQKESTFDYSFCNLL
jgi:hypothetical protein